MSFTRDERIQSILAGRDHRFEMVQMHINNYWHGHCMKHPVQFNLHGLPSDLVWTSFGTSWRSRPSRRTCSRGTYADWLEQAYGTTFAETFPMVYGPKYHTTSPNNMTTEWLGPRMYRPNLEEVLGGALETTMADLH